MLGKSQPFMGQPTSVVQRYIRYIPLALLSFLAVIVQPAMPTD
jgi:hypothetical protein